MHVFQNTINLIYTKNANQVKSTEKSRATSTKYQPLNILLSNL